jgi:hypothetical protein
MKSFFDVKKEYDSWLDVTGQDLSLSDYAKLMDKTEGSNDRHKAYGPRIVSQANAYIDELFSPVGETLRPAGEAVGNYLEEPLGLPDDFDETAGDMAASLPRMAAEFAAFFVPGGQPAAAARVGTTALKAGSMVSAYLRGHQETDSPVGGAISAAMLPAMPAAGQAAQSLLGKSIAKTAGGHLAELTGKEASRALIGSGQAVLPMYAASQTGMVAAVVVGDVAMQSVAARDPLAGLELLKDKEYYVLQAMGQVPFLGLDILRLQAEINIGRKINQRAAVQRAEIWDVLTSASKISEADKRNERLDLLADQIDKIKKPDSEELQNLYDRWEDEAPYAEVQKRRFYISPKQWKATEQYRYKTPEDIIALTRAFNETVATMKAEDKVTLGELRQMADELFADGATAESLQKAFNQALENGDNYNQATLRVVQQMKNRLGRATSENVRLNALKVRRKGDAPEAQEVLTKFPATGNLFTDIKQHFQRSFENSGIEPAAIPVFVDIAQRYAGLFDGTDVRLGELRNKTVKERSGLFDFFGLFMPKETEYMKGRKLVENYVALMSEQIVDNPYHDAFLKMSILGHELFHAHTSRLKKAYEDGTLSGPDRIQYERYQKSLESFKGLDAQTRHQILRQTHDVLVPEFMRGNEMVEAMIRQAAQSPEETLTMLAQFASTGVVSPSQVRLNKLTELRAMREKSVDQKLSGEEQKEANDRANALSRTLESLKFLPDEVVDFQRAQYRDLSMLSNAMRKWYGNKIAKGLHEAPGDYKNDILMDFQSQFVGPKAKFSVKNGMIKKSDFARWADTHGFTVRDKADMQREYNYARQPEDKGLMFLSEVEEILSSQLPYFVSERRDTQTAEKSFEEVSRIEQELGEFENNTLSYHYNFQSADPLLDLIHYDTYMVLTGGQRDYGTHGDAVDVPNATSHSRGFVDGDVFKVDELQADGRKQVRDYPELNPDDMTTKMVLEYGQATALRSALTTAKRLGMKEIWIPDSNTAQGIQGFVGNGRFTTEEYRAGFDDIYNKQVVNQMKKFSGQTGEIVVEKDSTGRFLNYERVYRKYDLSKIDPSKFTAQSFTNRYKKSQDLIKFRLDDEIKNVSALLKSTNEVKEAALQLQQAAAYLRPEALPDFDAGFIVGNNKQVEAFKALREKMGIYTAKDVRQKEGLQLGFFERLFGNPSQMAKMLEKRGLTVASDVINHIQDIPSQISRLRTDAMMPFTTTNKGGKRVNMLELDAKDVKNPADQVTKNALDLITSDQTAWAAFSEIALLHNEMKTGLDPQMDVFQQPNDKLRSYEKLDPDQKTKVWDIIEKVKEQNRTMAKFLMTSKLSSIAFQAGKILRADNPDISSRAALRIVQDAARALSQLPLKDFSPEGLSALAGAMQQMLGPDVKGARAAQFLADLAPAYFRMANTLQKQSEYYFSEQRYGDHLLVYNRLKTAEDGSQYTETVTEAFDKRRDLASRIKQVEAEGGEIVRSVDKRKAERPNLPIGRDRMLESLIPLEEAMYDKALRMLGPEEAELMRDTYKPGKAMLAEVKKQQTADVLKRRKLAAGREYLDMFHTAIEYYNSVSYKLGNEYAREYADYFLGDKQMDPHPQLRRELLSWADNLVNPQSKEFQSVKNGIFSYFLGFNLSSMLIESVQPAITTLPMIIEETGSVLKANRLMASAYKDLGLAYTSSKTEAGRLSFKDKELEAFFKQAIDEDMLDYGSIEDMARPTDALKLNAARLKDGRKGMTVAELATHPLHLYSKYSRGLYSFVSGTHAKASFIIGYKLGKQRGLQGKELYRHALSFIRRTTFSGGEYNRAFGFKGLGKAQSSVGVLYTLSNFTFATLHMMSRLFKDSFADLPAGERVKSQKALGAMLGAQTMLAGAFGLPFAGAMLSILEQIFGESLYDDVRDLAYQLGGEDEVGRYFADVATRGLPTLLGVDAGSRFGLGSIMGFNEYNGFDLRNLTGAAGGVTENIYDALSHAAKGDLGKSVESAVPQVFKHPLEMARNDGKFLDAKGELLMQPNTTEQFLYLIGLQPKRFSDLRLAQRINRKADQTANRERRKTLSDLADRVNDLSTPQIQIAINDLVRNDPLFKYDDANDVTDRLLDILMERQIPLDPLESGSYASLDERERFAQTLPPVRKRQITEQQRLFLKSQLKSQLTGMPEQPSRRQLNRASMIDQFLQTNPTMSRQRARLATEGSSILGY